MRSILLDLLDRTPSATINTLETEDPTADPTAWIPFDLDSPKRKMVAPTKAEAIAALTRSSSIELIPLFIEHPKEDGPQKPSEEKHLAVKAPGVERGHQEGPDLHRPQSAGSGAAEGQHRVGSAPLEGV
jgi:hypothetical protein